jgi:hypothetical protein
MKGFACPFVAEPLGHDEPFLSQPGASAAESIRAEPCTGRPIGEKVKP